MNIKTGLVGLPNVGKSTLFNALTNASIPAENYPFCTIDPHIAITNVVDNRLEKLKKIYNSEKIIHSTIEFVDIAGLVAGASTGAGLGNKFLSNIREVAIIIHVLRCFDDNNVINTQERVDPIRDFEIIQIELALKDIESIDQRMNKISGLMKKNLDTNELEKYKNELPVLKELKEAIEKMNIIRAIELAKIDEIIHLNFLLAKPYYIVANIGENDISNPLDNIYVKNLYNYFKSDDIVLISAKFELEISKIEDENLRKEYMNDFGIEDSGINKIIKKSYQHLGLISFFTCGPKEIHSWTIQNGINIKKAAGEIHSDLERGFISANVIGYYDMLHYESEFEIKNQGKMKTVGNSYIVSDGDILNINFNV